MPAADEKIHQLTRLNLSLPQAKLLKKYSARPAAGQNHEKVLPAAGEFFEKVRPTAGENLVKVLPVAGEIFGKVQPAALKANVLERYF